MAEIEQISIKIGDALFEFASNEQAKELRDMLNRIFPLSWTIPASVPQIFTITVSNPDPTGNQMWRVVNQILKDQING